MMDSIYYDLELCYQGKLNNDDGEPVDLMEYLDDALDVDYRVDCNREPIGCRVWLALGGPNIWIDTEQDSIFGAWGTDRDRIYIESELSEAVLEALTADWN